VGPTLHHLDTFWQARQAPNVALFHFADLTADLDSEMRRLADVLEIDVAEDGWAELVEAAGLASMKERAEQVAPEVRVDGFWKDTASFFHHGGSGQWTELVGPGGEECYRRRVEALVDEDLAGWVHEGWSGRNPTTRHLLRLLPASGR
jgi:aryl sulfotransferase